MAKTCQQKGPDDAGLTPIVLAAKEGLALINGTQTSTALALRGYFMAQDLLAAATVVGSMSIDAAKGSDAPFDARIHDARGHHGRTQIASAHRQLIADSQIRASHKEDDERVQDPHCLRCQPQVMGACLDVINQAGKTLLIEANAVTDNPLIFNDNDGPVAISGGNFHAEPVAFAADMLALAISEIGSMSERRIALLIDATLSGLPAFLVKNPGGELRIYDSPCDRRRWPLKINHTLTQHLSTAFQPLPTKKTMCQWRLMQAGVYRTWLVIPPPLWALSFGSGSRRGFSSEEGYTHRQNLPVFIKHYAKASPIMTVKTATLPQTSKTPNSWQD